MNDEHLSRESRRRILDRYRVTDGDDFRLDRVAPDDLPLQHLGKADASVLLQQGVAALATMQERLYADATWSLLIVLQAMDAAGKDGTIRHVMSGVNPQGVVVTSFKAPSSEEMAHDFLWRHAKAMPARGMIGVHNRSHYEEVLVARVHPDILAHQHLPDRLTGGDKFWSHRLQDIRGFERHLARQGTVILKFFLNVSREEQKRRFLSRLEEPDKNWKFSSADIAERAHWDSYMHAYQEAIAGTAKPHAPWFVVPADRKWFCHLVVAAALVEAMENLDLAPPRVPDAERVRLEAARKALESEA